MLGIDNISRVWASCEFTGKISKQEQVAKPGDMLSAEGRELRARLILEEAVETINALGFEVIGSFDGRVHLLGTLKPDLDKIIDGCCDLDYVTKGTLVAFNIPDEPHTQAVCEANEAKFPNGVPVPHPTISGKFGKPEGWQAPNHMEVMKSYVGE